MRKSIINFLFVGAIAFGLVSCNGKSANTENASDTKTVETEKIETQPVAQEKAVKVATIIDFNATWCPPCQKFKPIFKELEKEYAGKITFKDIDVDQNQDLAMKWKVESIPTILFQDAEGNEIAREVGFRTKEQMVALINKFQ